MQALKQLGGALVLFGLLFGARAEAQSLDRLKLDFEVSSSEVPGVVCVLTRRSTTNSIPVPAVFAAKSGAPLSALRTDNLAAAQSALDAIYVKCAGKDQRACLQWLTQSWIGLEQALKTWTP